VVEIARRLRATSSGISKHFTILRESQVVVRRYGNYTLPAGVRSADGSRLDFGCVVLRFDREER